MSGLIIKKVELKNWFNYFGDYSENVFDFEKGINFLAADNNAGKSKLHNALRWFLEDEIILRDQTRRIDYNNLTSLVVNNLAFSSAKVNEKIEVGVILTISKFIGNTETKRKLKKEISFRKNSTESFYLEKRVLGPGRGNSWTFIDEPFEDRSNFIPALFRNFLFLEGEQINKLIPFEGIELRNTINSITNIGEIDSYLSKAYKIRKELTSFRERLQTAEEGENEKNNIAKVEKTKAEKEKDRLGTLLKPLSKKKIEKENRIEKIKEEAEKVKHQKKVIKKISEFNTLIEIKEDEIDNEIKNYYNLISRDFRISFYLIKPDEADYLNKNYRKIILDIKSMRLAELEENIDQKKQQMVARLIKNQPGVEILEEIAEKRECFVCGTDHLTDNAVEYIKEHLIPHFNGTKKVDDKLVELSQNIEQLLNNAMNGLNYFNFSDDNIFEQQLNKIGNVIEERNNLETNRKEYIDENGDGQTDDENEIIKEFEKCSNWLLNNSPAIGQYIKLINEQEEIIINNDKVLNTPKKGESKKLSEIKESIEFQDKLIYALEKIKTEEYAEFCNSSSLLATKRLHKFFGNNPGIKDLKFSIIGNKNNNGEFDFKIRVIDKKGIENQEPGGAETSIRQFCVVLSLLEIAKQNNASIGNFPFILDAPISNLNPTYRFDFYQNLISENVTQQMIILTYDLVDGAKNGQKSKINIDGKNILERLKNKTGSFYFKADKETQAVNLK